MRVYEIARRMNLDSYATMKRLSKFGVVTRSPSTKVDASIASVFLFAVSVEAA